MQPIIFTLGLIIVINTLWIIKLELRFRKLRKEFAYIETITIPVYTWLTSVTSKSIAELENMREAAKNKIIK